MTTIQDLRREVHSLELIRDQQSARIHELGKIIEAQQQQINNNQEERNVLQHNLDGAIMDHKILTGSRDGWQTQYHKEERKNRRLRKCLKDCL
jgi:hypothetical protein